MQFSILGEFQQPERIQIPNMSRLMYRCACIGTEQNIVHVKLHLIREARPSIAATNQIQRDLSLHKHIGQQWLLLPLSLKIPHCVASLATMQYSSQIPVYVETGILIRSIVYCGQCLRHTIKPIVPLAVLTSEAAPGLCDVPAIHTSHDVCLGLTLQSCHFTNCLKPCFITSNFCKVRNKNRQSSRW